MLSKNSNCIGKWRVWCDDFNTIWTQRCYPKTSFIYKIDDLSSNDTYYLDTPGISEIFGVSKKDFESIKWPVWLSPGESIIITILQSGNYIIEDD